MLQLYELATIHTYVHVWMNSILLPVLYYTTLVCITLHCCQIREHSQKRANHRCGCVDCRAALYINWKGKHKTGKWWFINQILHKWWWSEEVETYIGAGTGNVLNQSGNVIPITVVNSLFILHPYSLHPVNTVGQKRITFLAFLCSSFGFKRLTYKRYI